jgi:NodT family efflux transporter outer membrane factor (OMF) lipoprotein
MKKLALALAAAALAGCSFIPTYERPAAPVPAAFPFPAAESGTPATQLPWQDFFPDPRLRQLIAIALANNRDLRVAALNVEVARAQYDIRRADLYPTLAAAFNGSREPVNGKNVTVYTAGLEVTSWEIDLFGRIRSLSEAGLAQYFATDEGHKAAQLSLIAAVAQTWLGVVADDEALALTQQTLVTRDESLRLTRLRFENGAASELDYRAAESLAENARAALAQLTRSRAADLNALALLLGQPVPSDFQTPGSTAAVQFADLPAGTPSEVLTARPDVRQAEQLLMSANANIGAARAAFFPHITLTAGAGTASTQLSGLFKSGTWAWTGSLTLAQTIFDAGRNRANLQVANVSHDIAVAQYEKTIQSAFREVSDALAGRATFDAQVEALRKSTDAETVRFHLSELRYDNGVASYLDLLDAQRSLYTAQLALVQTRLLKLQNQVQLYKALGGGWTPPPAESQAHS